MKLLFETVKSRKKTFCLILFLLMSNLLLYVYTAFFQQAKVETLQNDWLKKRSQYPMGAENKTYIYAQGVKDLALFRSLIPPKKDFTRVVGELFETAANNSIKVGKVGYKPELAIEGGLLVYTLDFTISGNYSAIKSFIADIEQTREMLFINHLALNSPDTGKESVNLKLQLSAYFVTEGK